jgi:hypothetical protein
LRLAVGDDDEHGVKPIALEGSCLESSQVLFRQPHRPVEGLAGLAVLLQARRGENKAPETLPRRFSAHTGVYGWNSRRYSSWA